MEFVVLILSVLAITFTVVIARPHDTEDHTKNGKYTEGDSNEQFKFMLPVAAYNLGENYEIEISGTLDLNHENFAAMLLPGVKEGASCKLNYNYERNEGLEISSELDDYKEFISYPMGNVIQNKTLTPEFRLSLTAMENEVGDKLLIIIFQNSGAGNCKVNSLDNLSYISFKEGVKKIHSIKTTATVVDLPSRVSGRQRQPFSRNISRHFSIIDIFDKNET